jgi:hypothetical protein
MIFMHISDAMKGRDRKCPICYLLDNFENRYYENLLYENVNDPSVRENIRRSLGFCPYHAFKLVSYVNRSPGVDGLGSSLIYIDMLSQYIERLSASRHAHTQLQEPGRLWASCGLCSYIREFELIYVDVFSKCFEESVAIYSTSSSILCYKHLYMIMNNIDSQSMGRLIDIQVVKLNAILKNAERFVDKHDYRFRGAIFEDEARAWQDAIEVLKGSMSSQIALISSYRDLSISNKSHKLWDLIHRLYSLHRLFRKGVGASDE